MHAAGGCVSMHSFSVVVDSRASYDLKKKNIRPYKYASVVPGWTVKYSVADRYIRTV